jgi:DNA-binding transcriptional LysR family regulator
MNHLSLDIRMLRSLISVVDTGSITKTARQLGRTQPAISLQMQRLEEIAGRVLFRYEARRMHLTSDGDTVLAYAKSIVQLHDELLSKLAAPEIQNRVVLGTPDLYAATVLPATLALFKEAFPRVQVELRSASSDETVERVQRGQVDIALVTGLKNFNGGLMVRQEQLVWLGGEHTRAHLEDPVRLAAPPRGNLYTEYAIDRIERVGRKWRIVCVSESIAAVQSAVFSGMAVAALGRSAITAGMRELTPEEGFLPLPKVDLLLYKAPGTGTPAVDALYGYLAQSLGETTDSAFSTERHLAASRGKPAPRSDSLLRHASAFAL